MFAKLRALFSATQDQPEELPACVPAGQRIYAIGDIHGRLDLFDHLLASIAADNAARGPADTTFGLYTPSNATTGTISLRLTRLAVTLKYE